MVSKFIKYLNNNLPIGCWAKHDDVKKEVVILNNSEYVYLFHEQEIEENFKGCCTLANYISWVSTWGPA